MTVREVIRMGHPTLRKLALPYPTNDIGMAEFNILVEDMRETLHAAGGIGLAAPQIDVLYQVVVIEIVESRTRYGEIETLPFSVFVNPKITVIENNAAGYWEGCLSIPGMMGYVKRPQHILVEYLDQQNKPRSMEVTGFLATVFQHEFDHLQGELYVDRISDMKLFAFEKEYQLFQLGDPPSGE
ncbi:MAG: peptide deformylase [bacterium]|nr:peptide deformylase [Gammaproteobacteria bacterium]HIL94437.1 peptide deformylase [Pseudomonadales bacterium]